MNASSRRRFLGAAVATAASYRRVLGANDRIRFGAIGTGGRGEYLMGNVAALENTEFVAVCDVYEPHRLRVKKRFAADAPDFADHRAVLDRKDIDAVIVATPDHWHVPITIDAVRAGKDVYCEKPVTHTLAEGAPLIAAVRESGRVVQTGTQQRSWEHFMHAKELIANGPSGR
jgi:predicted dehydrogenase